MAAESITPPNPLEKARNGNGPVAIDPEILDRAEQAVEELSGDYAQWAQQDIDGLRKAVALARSNPADAEAAISRIYGHALDLKGQGGGFGYNLITAVGDLLNRFVEGRKTISAVEFEIIDAHIDALQAVLRDGVKGDGGAVGAALVEGLQQLGATHTP